MPENELLSSKQAWLKLKLPACLDSLLTIQAALTEFAGRQGFPAEQRFKLELALEELVMANGNIIEENMVSEIIKRDNKMELSDVAHDA